MAEELKTYRVKQGTDQTIEIPDVRDANGALINPANVAGVAGQIRSLIDPFVAPNPLHTWTTPGTITVAAGKVTLLIPKATSSAWTWRTARFDVELTDTAGKTGQIARGLIELEPEMTTV